MSTADAIALGGFGVEASPDEIAAFRAATGLPAQGETLPLTFPIRWMASPAVRDAVATLAPESDLILVHESQTFDYATALRVGEPYTLTLTGRRVTTPDRLIVDGTVAAADGSICARLETILRLVSTTRAAA